MIRIGAVYLLAGLMFAAVAALSLRDRQNPKRLGNGLFWGLLAVSFLFGSRIGDFGNGLLALALAAIGGLRLMGQGRPATTEPAERQHSAGRLGNTLFLPALIVPATAMLGTLLLKRIKVGGLPLIDPAQGTVISLGLGIVIALAVAILWLRPAVTVPLQEARRLLDSVGWAVVLPQMLAALGAIFALSGAGDQIGRIVTAHIPGDSRFAAVAAYTVGMALFTMTLGNAFAAFPVMTAAIGLPILVHHWGGNSAAVAAIGMLSGFCGTLMTPMAANFNIVPTTLLELPDRWAVIKAQAPTALLMLIVNTALMYALVFRF
jgi:uncharacterized membrane protein